MSLEKLPTYRTALGPLPEDLVEQYDDVRHQPMHYARGTFTTPLPGKFFSGFNEADWPEYGGAGMGDLDEGASTFWTWAPLIGLAWGFYFLQTKSSPE
jgi:hypothetical protein